MAGSGNAHLRAPEDGLLRVENLFVEFPVGRTGLKVHAVSDVSVDVRKGETLGIVGESGCGKSTTGKAIMQIEPATSGAILFDGQELTTMAGPDLRLLRPEMQMIFQDPISSLNPRRKVGDIVSEPLRIWASQHNPPTGPTKAIAGLLRAAAIFGAFGFALLTVLWIVNGFIPYMMNDEEIGVFRSFYEAFLSYAGAVAIGAIVSGVAFVVSRGVHDRASWSRGAVLALALTSLPLTFWGLTTGAALGDSLVVASAVPADAFKIPAELRSTGSGDGSEKIASSISIDGSTVTVAVTRNGVAVRDTSGEAAGWAAAAALLLTFGGSALFLLPALALAAPAAKKDYDAMTDLRGVHNERVRKALSDVGLDPDTAWSRKPHQFSGGQCQRICIARALVLDPKVIICDEPVSALDVSVQAQILNLLEDMKARYDLTLVFIAHDLAVVKNISDRVAVMYLGKICEVASPDDLYANPAHPYTAALLSSIPVPDPGIRPADESILGGEIPSPVAPPSGCRFRTRCPKAQDRCAQSEPKMAQVALGHYVACHFPLEASGPKPGAAALAAMSKK